MIYIIGIIIVILMFVIIGIFNNLVTLRKKAVQSQSGIDVYLQQRFDLIPNLVEVTKGYVSHESEILENVAKLRAEYNMNKSVEAANGLTKQYKSIMAIIENYPDLKANQNFLSLQNDLKETEDKISMARQFYNDTVLTYNNKVETVPTNIIANLFGFKKATFFEVEESEKSTPKVSF